MPSLLPSTPVSIGGVLDSAFRLFGKSFSRCWPIALIIALCTGLYGVLYSIVLFHRLQAAATDLARLTSLTTSYGVLLSPPMLGAEALLLLVSPVCYGALFLTQNAVALGNPPPSLGTALGFGLRRLPAALGLGILTALALALGLILIIIPAFYVLGKLQLGYVALFVDGEGPVQAMKTSWRLTQRRWWRGITILGVAVIIVYVIDVAFGLVSGLLLLFAHLALTQLTMTAQVASAVAQLIVVPLMTAIALAMYHDFKLRSSGGDLAARVGALGPA